MRQVARLKLPLRLTQALDVDSKISNQVFSEVTIRHPLRFFNTTYGCQLPCTHTHIYICRLMYIDIWMPVLKDWTTGNIFIDKIKDKIRQEVLVP
jgi:hypothetical protein